MKTLIKLTCLQCGATLSIEEGREMLFCSYCGNKILINDENKHTIHYIDDAEIKRAETERMIQLKELEIEEKKRANKKVLVIIWLVLTFVLGLLGIIGMSIDEDGLIMCLMLAMAVGIWGALGLFAFPAANKKNKSSRVVNDNEVRITSQMCSFNEEHYKTVYGLYKGAGFENVTTVPLHNLNFFAIKKNGLVDSISIGGEEDFDEDDIFKKTDAVIITYHSTK